MRRCLAALDRARNRDPVPAYLTAKLAPQTGQTLPGPGQRAAFPQINQRRVFWENVFQGDIAERIFAGQDQGCRRSAWPVVWSPADRGSSTAVKSIWVGAGRAIRILLNLPCVPPDAAGQIVVLY